ncbi:helix-turn-helix domain-containing protein [Neofamilia massiliensis]|uniref:helix-turn-helix domain-containing protein n=1 Tax=Neofamilia massiliensis TaxID=1673724 RepID=UPI0006BB8EF3|nr:helix-turn-helix transcriptional regulator [Neofamilia massiliensis]
MARIGYAELLILLPYLIFIVLGIYLFILIVKALKTYIKTNNKTGDPQVKKTIGQIIKSYRTENNMTQEYLAEALGISRQSVSKWEQGITEPSTSNLLALAKVFHVSPEELLKNLEK